MAKVVKLNNEEVAQVAQQEVRLLQVSENDANIFLRIVDIIMLSDDRAKPIKQHFLEMLKINNEKSNEQPS